jgi:hypothetical protein
MYGRSPRGVATRGGGNPGGDVGIREVLEGRPTRTGGAWKRAGPWNLGTRIENRDPVIRYTLHSPSITSGV